jgi:hypothetical protein
MKSKRRLNLGMVSLVPGRVARDIETASTVRDEVETLLGSEFFDKAPFDSVGLVIRYGVNTNLSPEYERIERGELPLAVEFSMNRLRKAKGDELYLIFKWILIEALLAVCEKYNLQCSKLVAEKLKNPRGFSQI